MQTDEALKKNIPNEYLHSPLNYLLFERYVQDRISKCFEGRQNITRVAISFIEDTIHPCAKKRYINSIEAFALEEQRRKDFKAEEFTGVPTLVDTDPPLLCPVTPRRIPRSGPPPLVTLTPRYGPPPLVTPNPVNGPPTTIEKLIERKVRRISFEQYCIRKEESRKERNRKRNFRHRRAKERKSLKKSNQGK